MKDVAECLVLQRLIWTHTKKEQDSGGTIKADRLRLTASRGSRSTQHPAVCSTAAAAPLIAH